MADSSKPWQRPWFWGLMIPVGGVMYPVIRSFPLQAWWFWLIAGIFGCGAFVAYQGIRSDQTRALNTEDVAQLKAEVQALRLELDRLPAGRALPEDQSALAGARRGIVVVLCGRFEGFASWVERYGDEGAYERMQRQLGLVRGALERHGGDEVKRLEEGFVARFSSAREALLGASEIQAQLQQLDDEALPLCLGLHAGEPLEGEDGLHGRALIVAQQVATQARGGTVLLSDVVKNLVGPLKGFQYVERGKRRLQGITEPYTLYEFHAVEALQTPLDTVVDRRLGELEQQLEKSARPGQRGEKR